MKNIGLGGLTGSPIKDMSTNMIKYIYQKSSGSIPIIAVGGIMSPDDAIEKIEAGASLVQLYTGFIYEGPLLIKRINKAILKKYRNGVSEADIDRDMPEYVPGALISDLFDGLE